MDTNRLSRLNVEDHTLNPHEREALIQLKLEAEGAPALYEKLLSLKTFQPKGAYALRWLWDVGGQGVIYLGEDLEQDELVVIKIPVLPYHRPGDMDSQAIKDARDVILWEAYFLSCFPGTILPEIYDFFDDFNPLHHPAWGRNITFQEPYLVMEFIPGWSLDIEIARRYGEMPVRYDQLEQMAWLLAQHITDLCETMWQYGQLLYVDLRPQNILVTGEPVAKQRTQRRRHSNVLEDELPPRRIDARIRLVDVSSIVLLRPDLRTVPYHPSYVPPEFYESVARGEFRVPNPSFVIYTLGKTIHQLLTNRTPLPGNDPDFSEPILAHYSSEMIDLVRKMITGGYSSFTELGHALLRDMPKDKLIWP